jgi:hypothetical protein
MPRKAIKRLLIRLPTPHLCHHQLNQLSLPSRSRLIPAPFQLFFVGEILPELVPTPLFTALQCIQFTDAFVIKTRSIQLSCTSTVVLYDAVVDLLTAVTLKYCTPS